MDLFNVYCSAPNLCRRSGLQMVASVLNVVIPRRQSLHAQKKLGYLAGEENSLTGFQDVSILETSRQAEG